MGYKNKTWIKESAEAPYFVLEKNIYKNLNVSVLGYVTAMADDERLAGKVKKYTVKCGPVVAGKSEVDYVIYDVTCLEHINITQEEINSGKCVVMILFLDTNPKNFYNLINGVNHRVEDKLGTDKDVENIMHDYRNGVIVGKLKFEEEKYKDFIPSVSLSRSYRSGLNFRYTDVKIVSGEGFNPDTDMFWMYVYMSSSKELSGDKLRTKKYSHPLSPISDDRPFNIVWHGDTNRYMDDAPSEWRGETINGKIYSSRLFTFEQVQSLAVGLSRKTGNRDFIHLGFRVVRLDKNKEVTKLGPLTYARLRRKHSDSQSQAPGDSRLVDEWDFEIHSK